MGNSPAGPPSGAIVIGRDSGADSRADVDSAVILQFGEDEELATFARGLIAEQSAEIAWMRDWLARHGE